jgi:SAM-dependent methyltransferase
VTEWRFYDGVPPVSTAEFHADRERAPHLEQPAHRPRLKTAADLVREAAAAATGPLTVSDLGCGDGGLLSLLRGQAGVKQAWGYDFQPSNAAGWAERGVDAVHADVFGVDRPSVQLGDLTVTTEVLEHLADPHEAVRWIGEHSAWIVASSPWTEGPGGHDECHAWAWDTDGYRALLEQGGYQIVKHGTIGPFQLVLGRRL